MKILIADKDVLLTQAMSRFLREEGYEILSTNDEHEAVELLSTDKPDLVISDIMMPDLAGCSLEGLLRNFCLGKTPVIILSDSDKRNAFLTLYEMGATNFILKPVNFNELAACIRRNLRTPPKAA